MRSPPTSDATISSGTALKHELKRELRRLPRYLTRCLSMCVYIYTYIYICICVYKRRSYLSNDDKCRNNGTRPYIRLSQYIKCKFIKYTVKFPMFMNVLWWWRLLSGAQRTRVSSSSSLFLMNDKNTYIYLPLSLYYNFFPNCLSILLILIVINFAMSFDSEMPNFGN